MSLRQVCFAGTILKTVTEFKKWKNVVKKGGSVG